MFHKQPLPLRDADDVVQDWAEAETTGWLSKGISQNYLEHRFAELNEHIPTVFLFDLGPAGARLVKKPGIYDPEASANHPIARRAEIYLPFFQDTCFNKLSKRIRIAVDTDDLCANWIDVPVFAFQKHRIHSNILIPDVDFIATDFYEDSRVWSLPDNMYFKNKKDSAAFVGSTTGVKEISEKAIFDDAIPRIRSARFFRGAADVVFRLPNIVQTDCERTREILLQEGFGSGYIGWAEQLQHKFLISMDGNGATCSRVFIGLQSNSCLIKYESEQELFYFRGLEAGLHYISIVRDSDIYYILFEERNGSLRYKAVAEAGKRFAQDYLTKEHISKYTLCLFEQYAKLLWGIDALI